VTVYETSSSSSALPQPDRDNNENAAQLEDISAEGTPGRGLLCAGLMFSFSQDNPEFLPVIEAEDHMESMGRGGLATMILEKDGIPYINDDVCTNDKNAKGKLNGDFAKLVESVVHNREPL